MPLLLSLVWLNVGVGRTRSAGARFVQGTATRLRRPMLFLWALGRRGKVRPGRDTVRLVLRETLM